MKWLVLAVLFVPLSMPLAARAASPAPSQCAMTFDACLAECKTKFSNDTSGHAACVPQCSGKYAACDAGVAYDKAKPWVEEQAAKTKKFLDNLLDNLKKETPKEDAPKNKSI